MKYRSRTGTIKGVLHTFFRMNEFSETLLRESAERRTVGTEKRNPNEWGIIQT